MLDSSWVRIVKNGKELVRITWFWQDTSGLGILSARVTGPLRKQVRSTLGRNHRFLPTWGGTTPSNGFTSLITILQEMRLVAEEQEGQYEESDDWFAKRTYVDELVFSAEPDAST